jgi:hypothetical protein
MSLLIRFFFRAKFTIFNPEYLKFLAPPVPVADGFRKRKYSRGVQRRDDISQRDVISSSLNIQHFIISTFPGLQKPSARRYNSIASPHRS